MASALSATTRRLCRSLLSLPKHPSLFSISSFSTGSFDDPESDTDVTNDPIPETTDTNTPSRPRSFRRPLENGLDPGVYKAILVGQVGQVPVLKRLRSGQTFTLFSVGTGGIRNNRRPLDDEEPREYADRCALQWHRVAVYPEKLGGVAMKHLKPGSILYLEGNLETKIFLDPVTGLVRRIREIALRRDGRFVLVGKEFGEPQSIQSDLKGVGYY